jgi:ankyrin repeat protein
MNVVNWTASQRGDVDLMRHALVKGEYATTRYPFGHTALHRAAQGGHTRMCKHLIMNGANARARNAAGCMPEHYARESNRLECESMLRSMASGKFLLVNGADGEPRLVLEGSI